jgi:D-alanine-D-alanine ligase
MILLPLIEAESSARSGHKRLMRIGVIRTAASPCRCGEAVSEGLKTLGHEPLLVDSEEIELRVPELAHECDLVIDHTDTLRGRGLYRFVVRSLLEAHGARIVGSDAKACLLADNKVAAKERLSGAGISVAPGVAVTSKTWRLPTWLRPPLVLKPAFEHMSRGVHLVNTDQEAYGVAAHLLESLGQPILVESYIPGRELAVSLIEGPKGLQVLPPLEWRLGIRGPDFLTERSKLVEPVGERRDVLRADLPDDTHSEMEAMAQHAFRALGLRDYARFDIRLSSGGTLFFLEANTTPSLEPLEALALSAQWAGLDYPALVERMLSAALRRYEALPPERLRPVRIDLPTGPIELQIPEGVHVPPPSSIDLAGLLDVQEGEDVLDLGCGSGFLSIAAAKLGARRVVAIDLDPGALQAAAQNAHRNGVSGKVEIRAGSWYEPLQRRSSPGGQEDRFDVIIATPPQTPGLEPFGPKYGGTDGTRHLATAIDTAPAFLKPVHGRLWLLAISLANPPALWKHLHEHFTEVRLLRETERHFTGKEYDALQQGLFEHLLCLRASGHSEFTETKNGSYVFRNLFICATGPRET